MQSDVAAALGDPHLRAIARLELEALYSFAFLLTGSRELAATLARDAVTVSPNEPTDHRPAAIMRARVARRLRRRASVDDGGAPIVRALAACPPRERIVLVCVAHERLSVAESAFIAGCDPAAVEQLLARALARVSVQLDVAVTVPAASLPGMVRMGMLAVVEDLGELSEDPHPARPRADRRIAAAALVVGAVVAAGAVALSANRSPSPPPGPQVAQTFLQERFGYALVVAERWRPVASIVGGDIEGIDPARSGLAALEPSDDVAVFIPRRAHQRPGMLRVAVARSDSYDDDVAWFRDRAGVRRQATGAVVTAAADEVAGRPATRFRIDHPNDEPSCSGCRTITWIVHWLHGTTMTIDLTVPGGDDALLEEGWEMVRSIGRVPGSMRYAPAHGVVVAGLEVDEHLETLLQFLDARARGAGARAWIADAAREAREPDAIASYRVRLRETRDGTTRFLVTVDLRDRFGRGGSRDEWVTVGAGARYGAPWPSLILGSREARASSGG